MHIKCWLRTPQVVFDQSGVVETENVISSPVIAGSVASPVQKATSLPGIENKKRNVCAIYVECIDIVVM